MDYLDAGEIFDRIGASALAYKATQAEIWEYCADYASDCHTRDVDMYDPEVLRTYLNRLLSEGIR